MLTWTGNRFVIGGRTFQVMVELSDLYTLRNQDGYILGKPRRYIDKYCEYLSGKQFNNIFELGIFRGGSTIFLSEMFSPKKLVAIDFNSQPVGVLNRYAQEPKNQGKIYPFYGVDQSDPQKLSEIYQAVFSTEQLDLVVDDASHSLEETSVSFNFLFPRLRSGGIYIIEDWSWAHLENNIKGLEDEFLEKSSMANLIVDLVIASASVPALFDELVINDGFVMIKKGQAATDADFDVHNHNLYRGRALGKWDYFA